MGVVRKSMFGMVASRSSWAAFDAVDGSSTRHASAMDASAIDASAMDASAIDASAMDASAMDVGGEDTTLSTAILAVHESVVGP